MGLPFENQEYIESGGGGGATTLEALTDTNISNSQDSQILKYNSGKWINALPDPAEYIFLQMPNTTPPVTTTCFSVIGNSIYPLTVISQNQSWWGGFTAGGAFTFTQDGTYKISCKVVFEKTSSVPGGSGSYLLLDQNSVITGNYIARQVSVTGPLNGGQDNGLSIPLQLEYVVATTANTPYVLPVICQDSSYYIDMYGGTTLYIEKIG